MLWQNVNLCYLCHPSFVPRQLLYSTRMSNTTQQHFYFQLLHKTDFRVSIKCSNTDALFHPSSASSSSVCLFVFIYALENNNVQIFFHKETKGSLMTAGRVKYRVSSQSNRIFFFLNYSFIYVLYFDSKLL